MTTSTGTASMAPASTESELLQRLCDPDSSAWNEFLARYRGFVRKIASLRGLGPRELDEVAQDVYVRVFQTIHRVERRGVRGSFRHWLSRLTLWKAADRVRLRARDNARLESLPSGSSRVDPAFVVPSTADHRIEEGDRLKLARIALVRLQRRFRPLTLQIFGLHVLDGMDANRVACFLGVSRSQVYVAKLRVAPFLRREIRTILREACSSSPKTGDCQGAPLG